MAKSDEQIQKESDKRIAAEKRKGLPTTARKGSSVADWAGADATLLLQLVCAVGVEGGAVRYGYTRDGGAYSVGIYLGEDSKTYYCNEADGINDVLEDLLRHFE